MADGNWAQVLNALTTTTSIAGSLSEGYAGRANANISASQMESKARQERQIASDEERDFRLKQSAVLAKHRAAMGASGTDIGTGTPLMALSDFASEAELQAQRIRAGGSARAGSLEIGAEATRKAGDSLMSRSQWRAGSSLLSGAARGYELKTAPKKYSDYGSRISYAIGDG